MNFRPFDTIAALATPRGAGGIGIVKISGPVAVDILRGIFQSARHDAVPPTEFVHRKLYYGHIVHPVEGPVDEVMVSFMRGPYSYTTEDVVEINCHGGIVIAQSVLDLVLSQGAREAEPGEFTRRAFLGGRISLAQAEGVIDLVNAKTRRAAQAGLRHLENGVDTEIQALQADLVKALATLEACIDFDDDLDEPLSLEPLARELNGRILPRIEALMGSYRQGRILREGVRIVVAGRPNVGKSSLVNRLLNQDRVIVNAAPGTTRDIVEETIAIDGAPIVLADTAGIHRSSDPVEAQGIERSRAAIESADLVLLVVDLSVPLSTEDQEIYRTIKDRPHLVVQNKADLLALPPAGPPALEGILPETAVALSALEGDGVERLKDRIAQAVGLVSDSGTNALTVNRRQAVLLEKASDHMQRAVDLLERDDEHEIISIEIKDGIDALGQILGIDTPPDVLDQIFEQFCIGK